MSDLQAQAEAAQAEDANADAALQQDAEPGTQDSEASGAEKETPVEAKTYTEEEVRDRIERATAKAAAKAERRALREATERLERLAQQPRQAQVDQRPQRIQGESDDDYIERLTEWKLDQRDKKSRQQREQERNQSLVQKTESIYAQAAKEPGFDREEFDSLELTPHIASALMDSDVTPKLMAYMVNNPEDVARIAKLSPARQAAEIGKLEVQLSTVKTSKAPSPITPIGSKGRSSPSLEDASMEEYAKLRKAQGAPWAQR